MPKQATAPEERDKTQREIDPDRGRAGLRQERPLTEEPKEAGTRIWPGMKSELARERQS